MAPAATFDSVPCMARPIARPAAPSTASKLAVCTPNCPSTVMRETATIAYFTKPPKNVVSVASSRLMPAIRFLAQLPMA